MPAYSVIVPVRNEANILRQTVPALLAATAGESADIIYVCNDCTDGSAGLIRRLGGGRVRVFETDQAGKIHAFNLGDAATDKFPRFYLDADVSFGVGDLGHMAQALISGEADLVAPVLRYDITGVSAAARAIARIWQDLPHGRTATYQGVIGLSEKARRRWGAFPDLTGDDIFIQAMVGNLPRKIFSEIQTRTNAPRTFGGWVRMRARWRHGERQLAGLGYSFPRCAGQRWALFSLAVFPQTAIPALLFLLVRLLAEPMARLTPLAKVDWLPEHRRDGRA